MKQQEGLLRAKEAVRKLVEALRKRGIRVEKIYLFGSYVRGDYLETSDVDAVLVSRDWEGMDFLKRLDIIYKTEWEEGIRPWIEAIPLTPEELEKNESAVIRDARRYWVMIPAGAEG